ncbi:MAG: hypothetical protein PHN51_10270 [Candidatus Nanopelagicales bacterium]|nr:hypothetical protein [Candidatus Nanopelagicales bacterium]
MENEDIFLARATSGFPVSIGTSLALETIFDPVSQVIDPDRKPPPKANRGNYNAYLINLNTIVRNIIQGVKTPGKVFFDVDSYYKVLTQEIEYLKHLFSYENLNLVIYSHTYETPSKKHSDVIRTVSTDQQKLTQAIQYNCVTRAQKEHGFTVYKEHLEVPKGMSALVLTHVPWDLLSHSSFLRLDLLESHTGAIKTRKDWNTKYFKIKDTDMSFLPFVEPLLVKLGDNVMFHPSPVKERMELIESLKKKNAHPLMSEMTYKLLTAT